ncbi:MAG: class I SAM-dependent methyltransferase, partial [Pseudomonadota bacterium]
MSKGLLRRFLKSGVKQGRLGVVYSDGEADTFGTSEEGFPEIVVRFSDSRVPRDIILDPRLGAAEAFMDGRLIIEEGDVMGLVGLLRMNSRWERGGQLASPSLTRRVTGHFGWLAERVNNTLTSRENVAHHYDIGNDLYALMLDDEHWQYSCAYWDFDTFGADMTLAQAQGAKLAHIAKKLAITPGN